MSTTKYSKSAKLDYIIEQLTQLGARMSALSDKIAETTVAMDAAIARVQEDVAALRQQIADLETRVAQNPTPEDLAALDALKAKADALDPVVNAVL